MAKCSWKFRTTSRLRARKYRLRFTSRCIHLSMYTWMSNETYVLHNVLVLQSWAKISRIYCSQLYVYSFIPCTHNWPNVFICLSFSVDNPLEMLTESNAARYDIPKRCVSRYVTEYLNIRGNIWEPRFVHNFMDNIVVEQLTRVQRKKRNEMSKIRIQNWPLSRPYTSHSGILSANEFSGFASFSNGCKSLTVI